MADGTRQLVQWFSELGIADVPLVGGKNASLGQMYRELGAQGVRVPNGFAITAEAYRYVLDQANAWPALQQALEGLDADDVDDLARRAAAAREIVYGAPLPEDLATQIIDAHAALKREYGDQLTVAVRSSATAEDLPTASFAGQHETFLNIAGASRLLDAVRHCFASLFKDRAIRYRIDNGFDHFKVFLSVGVMKMVRADLAASGVARVIGNVAELNRFRPGEILVADTTTPDWGTVMKGAAAVITNRGGRTCHAAIVAREIGIPAVVGCDDATERIRSGDEVTVSCAEGDAGFVYAGRIPFTTTRTDLSSLPHPQTRLMVNLGNPDVAFQTSFLPTDGVGLARMEFIVAEHIKVHPMALVHPEKIDDPHVLATIKELTHTSASPAEYFVRNLAEGVATIAAAFFPRPVIVRMSDFKTNEYASLLGGRWFEPAEANPMIGFRGASRYAHPAYADGFALECEAMKKVRDVMGLTNVKLMIPFCRRIQEAITVLDSMARQGLRRGENGLEIYVMCEIPNNVVQIDAFARLFDGFSIGSNDLTQLVLGVDRDSEIVAFDFDERDEGVKILIRQTVEGARRNGRHSGICGQAPSDYPEMAEYLVELGIDSISLNPDTFLKTTRHVLAVEQRLGRAPRTG